jgi:adenosylhomocysteine nucleosidase
MKKVTGILGAMPEEIEGIKSLLSHPQEVKIANRTFFTGSIYGQELVLVFSGWGKVAAASTVSVLIHYFKVDEILFVGLAGALHPDLKMGDIVLGHRFYQHDMDARPFFQQFEIPLSNQLFVETDSDSLQRAEKSLLHFLRSDAFSSGLLFEKLEFLGLAMPKYWLGEIASGDKFVRSQTEKDQLLSALPGLLCVEMEGAAVAQVCRENQIPFIIIRIISDTANEDSHLDFPFFIQNVAAVIGKEIVKHYFEGLEKS